MAIEGFSKEDFAAILELCQKYSVSELCCGDLRLSFNKRLIGDNASVLRELLQTKSPWVSMPTTKVSEEYAENQEVIPAIGLTEEQKEEYKELIRQEMFMNDPVAYETALIDESLRAHAVMDPEDG